MTDASEIFATLTPAHPRPGGLLLVGTASTLRQLRLTLHLAGQSTHVIGCLTGPGKGQSSASGKFRMLGSWDAASVDRALSLGPIAQALICLPSAMASLAEPVTLRLAEHAIPWRWIATASDQLAGRSPLPASQGVSNPAAWTAAAGLLGRTPRPIDHQAVGGILRAQTVLITGSGGSIGSELARQVAAFAPAKLVLLERSENALFEIHREIRRLHPDLDVVPVLHDVTDASRTEWVVAQHLRGSGVIFHAAAHKHVPMMEEHPWAAIENNFYGTRWMADAAARAGADRFVMISTDKAVRPTSIMGATKRLAERYIQWLNARSATRFCMVRFGNVLGSACSVLPIWQEQLSRGGPVTVTHPEMVRYFMTIPEAAGLVLQSAALTGEVGQEQQGGEVFLLDMGQPIRILDLAQRFIRLHGLEPGSDIPVQFTGIRPGEKLFEELAYDGEDMIPTPHDSVRIWKSQPPAEREMRRIISDFDRLRHPATVPGTTIVAGASHLWAGADKQAILDVLRRAIPEMQTPASDLLPAKAG